MSKKVIAAAALALAACATGRQGTAAASHWATLTVMGPLEAGLLFHQRSSTPAEPGLALAWGDVCGEPDPKARAQAVREAQRRLEQASLAAAARGSWVVPLRQTLGAYDLARGGFPTGLRKGSVVRFDRSDFCRQDLSYLVAFRNGDDWAVLRLPEEAAVRFVRSNPARTVVHELEVEVVGWQPGPPGPTLLVDVVRLRTRDSLGDRVIFDSGAPGAY